MSNYPEKVLLNDAILNASEAKVSVFDRGFLFGDGVYEVMVQLDNRFFFGKEHLDRLESSLKKVRLSFELSTLPQKIDRLLDATGLTTEDCLLYIQVTRGTAPRKHAFPKDTAPTLLMYAVPFVLPEVNNKPVSAVTRPDFRWHRCDIKMTSLLGNVMANDFAIQNGHYEAIFNRDGKMTEGTHSNLFFVNEGMVFTHPADEHILNGITREIVLQLCRDNNIPYREEAIAFERINAMDEAFLTGTTTQIAAIRQIDDHTFYHRVEPGPVTKKLQQLFFELKKNPILHK
ncbi:aminotransferase class IV [Pricia sp. S334]|uniref:Aminotransferase class IV n=1 Tax=Pricia mediterranea TaxID=3076079 RepID=A0ABU3L8D8_9FLAO|nr:aminotransferase class IV [Pricia sp. S334]MDT7829332.1 aminotransferase class IV [Pricia sp. S334]